ncbi:nucleoside-diphosphate kinase [Candidatus Acetothermia bacterium]|nr:nucleoside-diphosphate kinase [Candidatus Acetothermia bacterium]MCI2426893.1 nucleoside-diphosphate kinase [Candidatus Acetothermia bacterium]MCI2428616.1 nucleoside-diphosphate kinase [Candidatus Acetothermia bacterium]
MKQQTLVLLKPDALQRGLIGKIIARFEAKGLKLIALKMIAVDEELARRHYVEHVEKEFFPELLQFIIAAPVVAMALEGEKAVEVVRTLIGATDPLAALPGTIRGDFGLNLTKNLIHGSDSPQSAARELETFFAGELLNYNLSLNEWIE